MPSVPLLLVEAPAPAQRIDEYTKTARDHNAYPASALPVQRKTTNTSKPSPTHEPYCEAANNDTANFVYAFCETKRVSAVQVSVRGETEDFMDIIDND